jgi:acetyl-CoA acyltransferase
MKEVVCVEAVRSPVGRSGWKGMEKKGQFAETSAQDLLAQVLKALVERVQKKSSKFNPDEIEDVLVGCLSQIGEQGLNIGRIALLLAGLHVDVAGCTVNRYCNAGLQAINFGAMSIMTGCGDIMVAGGVELMSHYPMGSDMQVAIDAKAPVFLSEHLGDTGVFNPMGNAAEMVAKKYNFSREDMDQFGLWSHQKAVKAHRDGILKEYVVPINTAKSNEEPKIVDTDETPRAQCLDDPEGALAKMAALPPRFITDGKVTAGNSSQIVDGAAAVMLMSSDKAAELGLEPLVKIKSMAVSGSEPFIMLLGPIPACQKAMKRANLTFDDMGCIEPNEAFASPCLAFAQEFNYAFDDPRVNPTGGAIALGHPIGATGVIYFTEMAQYLKREKKKYGIQMLCGGGGVGIATIVERV